MSIEHVNMYIHEHRFETKFYSIFIQLGNKEKYQPLDVIFSLYLPKHLWLFGKFSYKVALGVQKIQFQEFHLI